MGMIASRRAGQIPGRYLPGLAALRAPHFGPPFGFGQMAPSRARPSGQIRWVSAQPSGRTIITIWSNLNAAYC